MNTKTLEVKLTSLKGVVGIGDDNTIELVTDIEMLVNFPTSKKQQDKDKIFDNPTLPPEFFYESELNLSQKFDSWGLGSFLYFMIFGEEPKPLTHFATVSNLRQAREPSDYIFFDILNETNLALILKHDYSIDLGNDENTLITHALKQKSYQGIFDHFGIQRDINNKETL